MIPLIRISPQEAKKWETGLKIILDAIHHHRSDVITSDFLTTGKVHGNICPQTVGILRGTMGRSAYISDPTSQPFNIAFQSTAWLQHALDIKCINKFTDNKERLEALNLCIHNAKSIVNTTMMSAPANPRAAAAIHDALLIPTSYVDDLESFIFVLADFCMRNSNISRRRSEFPVVPKWIADPVSHAALIDKERILEYGICAWEHEHAEFVIFSKLFEDLAKYLKRARAAEKMYQTIDEAVGCGNRWSTGSAMKMDVGQRQELLIRRKIEVGRAYTFFIEAFLTALKQLEPYL